MSTAPAAQPEITPPSAEQWDAIAQAYTDNLTSLAHGPYAMLLRAAEIGKGSRFIDLGTGPGYLAAEAANRGAEVIGIDFSEKMLEIARFNAPDVEMRHGEATMMPVERRQATAVVANLLLHLLPDPVACVLDATRILESGGVFAATVWLRHDDNPAIGLFYKAAAQCEIEVPVASQAGIPLWDPDKFSGILHRARLSHTEVRTVEWILRVKADEWWSAMVAGGPITGVFLRSLDGATFDRVRAAFLAQMSRLPREDDEVLLPARAMLGMGRVVR